MENATTNASSLLTKILEKVTTDVTKLLYNVTMNEEYTGFTDGLNDTTTASTTSTTTTTKPTTRKQTTTTLLSSTSTVVATTTRPTTSTTTTTSIPFELFKLITTNEPDYDVNNNSTTNKSICTKLITTSTTTEKPFDEFGPPEGLEYIFVPLGVMIFVIILSGVVLIMSRKRKLEVLKNRLMPLYNLEPGDEAEDDWETELLDETLSGRQRRGYQTMEHEDNHELYSH
ncbi:integumentary mucin C.1-like isoform X2 [Aphidius gifuensis]|uniref:integumentary mucin C.1-like isoform X2 n=1 Tax=Aphidius gifuensis TaxID=684658 RepID=UPI001CDB5A7D|nr:integumentary mucin C.1-like isoform X2 [Aphidius gifuensis]